MATNESMDTEFAGKRRFWVAMSQNKDGLREVFDGNRAYPVAAFVHTQDARDWAAYKNKTVLGSLDARVARIESAIEEMIVRMEEHEKCHAPKHYVFG